MPYKSRQDLPQGVRDHLPAHAEEIYKEAFNNALKQYQDPKKKRDPNEDVESIARKVAWAAVKNVYIKNEKTGMWEKGK